MIRWPYKWRKKEGIFLNIPYLAGAIYKWDCFVENCFIKFARLPKSGIWRGEDRKKKIVVSLTTFPARINECYYAIKSLMIQSYPADRIVLWLAKNQFPDEKLPLKFDNLIARGLEVRYCDEDLRSHKKYYYALQEQKEDELIVTFDDDIIYEYDAILKLVDCHKRYPNSIICNRGHHITSNDGKIESYNKWKICSVEGVYEPSVRIMPSTGAGCLYPYGVMPKTTFDRDAIRDYAFTADDIWMLFNRLSVGVSVVKTLEKSAILCNVYGSQNEALTVINDIGHENERTIERLKTLFTDLLDKCL